MICLVNLEFLFQVQEKIMFYFEGNEAEKRKWYGLN